MQVSSNIHRSKHLIEIINSVVVNVVDKLRNRAKNSEKNPLFSLFSYIQLILLDGKRSENSHESTNEINIERSIMKKKVKTF